MGLCLRLGRLLVPETRIIDLNQLSSFLKKFDHIRQFFPPSDFGRRLASPASLKQGQVCGINPPACTLAVGPDSYIDRSQLTGSDPGKYLVCMDSVLGSHLRRRQRTCGHWHGTASGVLAARSARARTTAVGLKRYFFPIRK